MYEKATKRNGNEFGPYYYKNIRMGKRIRTFYLGKDEEKAKIRERELLHSKIKIREMVENENCHKHR